MRLDALILLGIFAFSPLLSAGEAAGVVLTQLDEARLREANECLRVADLLRADYEKKWGTGLPVKMSVDALPGTPR